MSTRAVYIFKDETDKIAVYKHHDGYPSGALDAINNALALAWPLPRFEADEFAAAFVAANKPQPNYPNMRGGGIRLMTGSNYQHMPSDIEYLYEVTCDQGQINVAIYETNFWGVRDAKHRKLIDKGALPTLIAKHAEK